MNPNLAPQFRKYLEMSDEERIYFIQKDKWIDYPLANKVLLKMQDIFLMLQKVLEVEVCFYMEIVIMGKQQF